MSDSLLFVVHLAATWYLVGLIWMVQVVHYAMFDRVGVEEFIRYESDHCRLITPIVAIPMSIELVTGIALLWSPSAVMPAEYAWAGLAMIVTIWLSTALIQVPCHNCLTKGFDAAAYRRLVRTNWIRTALWSGRGLMLASVAVQGSIA